MCTPREASGASHVVMEVAHIPPWPRYATWRGRREEQEVSEERGITGGYTKRNHQNDAIKPPGIEGILFESLSEPYVWSPCEPRPRNRQIPLRCDPSPSLASLISGEEGESKEALEGLSSEMGAAGFTSS